MRVKILNALAGALGLASVAAQAPALSLYSSDPESCGNSVTTVYVTVPATSGITLSELPTATVYVTVPASSTVEVNGVIARPTSTSTLHSTLLTTTNSPQASTIYVSSPLYSTIYIIGYGYTMTTVVPVAESSSAVSISESFTPSYDVTVTESDILTVGLVLSGSGSMSTTTPISNEIINYTVENGTTYWLNGQTPTSTESYIIETSAVSVIPIYPTAFQPEETNTVTLQSTIFRTQQLTLTETLLASTSTAAGISTSPAVGTVLTYAGMASGGWNASSTAGGVITSSGPPSMTISTVYTTSIYTITSCAPTVTNCPARLGSVTTDIISLYTTVCPASANNAVTAPTTTRSSITLVTAFPSINIYQTSYSTIPISSFAAESGFHAITASSSSSAASTAAGAFAINGSSTLVSNASALSSSLLYLPSSVAPIFVNSTFPASAITTSSTLGSATSSNSLLSLLSSVGAEPNTTFVTSSTATSSALGVVTSLSSGSSLAGYSFSSAAFTTLKTSTSPTTLASSQVSNSSSTSSIASTSAGVLASSKSSTSLRGSTSYVATSVSSSASATPSSCGEYGNFTLNFDDIPPLSISNGTNPNTVQPAPVFNPYHQFDFSDGFTVVPPPTDPYLPSSKPQLLEFIPNFNVNGTNQQAGPNTAEEGYSGQISDGDGGATGCFAFNMYGASFGCDSRGPDCDFTFTGYREDPVTHNITQVASRGYAIPACPALSNCSLIPITLDNTFQNLVYVRINVTVQLQPKIWWMDDLRLGWFNNSCTTGLCRQNAHLP